MTKDEAMDFLARLAESNDVMRVGATAFRSCELHRPAQPGDVGRGYEVAFSEALTAVASAIARGAVTPPFQDFQSPQQGGDR